MSKKKAKEKVEVRYPDPIPFSFKAPMIPIAFEELNETERTSFVSRMFMAVDETDFITVDIEDDEFSIEQIPPLQGSIETGKQEGIMCPWIFMSQDPWLVRHFLSDSYYARKGVLRVVEFTNDTEMYFIGFECSEHALFFAWGFVY